MLWNSFVEYQTENKFHLSGYWLIFILVLFWWLLILAAPVLAAMNFKFSSGFIYLFFSKICHQMPERSFFIFGKQLAVCIRCSGLYFGFFLGTVFFPFLYRMKRNLTPAPKYFYLALIPLFLDFFLNYFHLVDNTAISRFLTGQLLGTVAVYFVLPGFLSLYGNIFNRKI